MTLLRDSIVNWTVFDLASAAPTRHRLKYLGIGGTAEEVIGINFTRYAHLKHVKKEDWSQGGLYFFVHTAVVIKAQTHDMWQAVFES
jgi:hypothetical protein